MVVDTTKESVCINQIVGQKNENRVIEGDMIVPDIKPDVVNVINTNGMVYLIKEQVENGKIKIEGNIDNYIVYLSVEGDNRSVSNTINFFEVIEDERINENVIVNVKAMILSMETKVLNERKLSTTIYLVLKIELSEENEIEVEALRQKALMQEQQLNDINNLGTLLYTINGKETRKPTSDRTERRRGPRHLLQLGHHIALLVRVYHGSHPCASRYAQSPGTGTSHPHPRTCHAPDAHSAGQPQEVRADLRSHPLARARQRDIHPPPERLQGRGVRRK